MPLCPVVQLLLLREGRMDVRLDRLKGRRENEVLTLPAPISNEHLLSSLGWILLQPACLVAVWEGAGETQTGRITRLTAATICSQLERSTMRRLRPAGVRR
jgi:hypothetical protein